MSDGSGFSCVLGTDSSAASGDCREAEQEQLTGSGRSGTMEPRTRAPVQRRQTCTFTVRVRASSSSTTGGNACRQLQQSVTRLMPAGMAAALSLVATAAAAAAGTGERRHRAAPQCHFDRRSRQTQRSFCRFIFRGNEHCRRRRYVANIIITASVAVVLVKWSNRRPRITEFVCLLRGLYVPS